MATVICPGCFDLFHNRHRNFLLDAARLGGVDCHTLVVCVNTDESAIALKRDKWGEKYPINTLEIRLAQIRAFGESVGLDLFAIPFDSEDDLRKIIANWLPCVIAKGPDYAGEKVTGAEIAPVILINTPETEPIRQMKRDAYTRARQ